MANPYAFDISDMIHLTAIEYEVKAISATQAKISVHGAVKNEYPATPKGYVLVEFYPQQGALVQAKEPMIYYPGRQLEFDQDLYVPLVRGVLKGTLVIKMAPFEYSEPRVLYRKEIAYTYEDLTRPRTHYEDEEGSTRTDSPAYEGYKPSKKKEANKSDWILYIGLGLVIAGIVIYLLRRS